VEAGGARGGREPDDRAERAAAVARPEGVAQGDAERDGAGTIGGDHVVGARLGQPDDVGLAQGSGDDHGRRVERAHERGDALGPLVLVVGHDDRPGGPHVDVVQHVALGVVAEHHVEAVVGRRGGAVGVEGEDRERDGQGPQLAHQRPRRRAVAGDQHVADPGGALDRCQRMGRGPVGAPPLGQAVLRAPAHRRQQRRRRHEHDGRRDQRL
jgi:hypothetical protein